MEIPSILRISENKALSELALTGSVLDIGGDSRSAYRTLIKGSPVYTTINLNLDANPDIQHDLENPLPLENNSFNHVLLINVLEHIFNAEQLLREAVCVVKPGGTVTVVVPFLFPVHPSPQDYWRFTDASLERLCEKAGLIGSSIKPLASGVFRTRHLLLTRLMPFPLRFVAHYTLRYGAYAADWLMIQMSRLLKKSYDHSEYAFGYVVTASK